jgi:hypothetical protein
MQGRKLMPVVVAGIFLAAIGTASLPGLGAAAGDPAPVELVERQLAAYNAKDLEAFVAVYAPDVELFEFPDKPLAKGTAAMRERYQQRFADPILHCTIKNRIVVGNRVIDQEHIRRTWPEGPGTWDAVAIYEVKGALIQRVWFLFGAKTVDSKN